MFTVVQYRAIVLKFTTKLNKVLEKNKDKDRKNADISHFINPIRFFITLMTKKYAVQVVLLQSFF